jgi:hypothetical protein
MKNGISAESKVNSEILKTDHSITNPVQCSENKLITTLLTLTTGSAHFDPNQTEK